MHSLTSRVSPINECKIERHNVGWYSCAPKPSSTFDCVNEVYNGWKRLTKTLFADMSSTHSAFPVTLFKTCSDISCMRGQDSRRSKKNINLKWPMHCMSTPTY